MQHIKIPLTAEYFGQKMLIKDSAGKTLGAFENPDIALELVDNINRYDKLIGLITRLGAVNFINMDAATRFVVLESFVMQANNLLTGKETMTKHKAPWMTKMIMGFEWLLEQVEDDLNIRHVPAGSPTRTTVVALRALLEEKEEDKLDKFAVQTAKEIFEKEIAPLLPGNGPNFAERNTQYINRIANGIAWRQQQFGE
jgi:hypothetical protein